MTVSPTAISARGDLDLLGLDDLGLGQPQREHAVVAAGRDVAADRLAEGELTSKRAVIPLAHHVLTVDAVFALGALDRHRALEHRDVDVVGVDARDVHPDYELLVRLDDV